jgi:hypothetical protein
MLVNRRCHILAYSVNDDDDGDDDDDDDDDDSTRHT